MARLRGESDGCMFPPPWTKAGAMLGVGPRTRWLCARGGFFSPSLKRRLAN